MALSATYRVGCHISTNGTSFATNIGGSSGSFTPAANSLMAVWVQNSTAGGASPSGVSGNGITYVKLANFTYATNEDISLWVAYSGASPSAGTTTATFAGTSGGCHINVIEITGHDASGTASQAFIGAVAGAFSSGYTGTGTATSGTLTLAAAGATDNRPMACFQHAVQQVTNNRTNWTEFEDGTFGSPSSAQESQWRSDTFETTASATWATSSVWGGACIEIKAAVAASSISFDVGQIPF